MKKQLYLYLFILSALVTVFTYSYFTKNIAHDKQLNDAEIKIKKDSINLLMNQLDDADHFSLDKNENAQNYFQKFDTQKLIPQIKEALLAYNDDKSGNKYTGQEKLGDQKFIISKIKILNHRWIIADYSDGQYWGDVLLKYFVDDSGKISFEIMDTFIYPKQNY